MISHVLIHGDAAIASAGNAGDVPWWSFTKTVLAAAALVLARDGRLTFDERQSGRPYTLRQLIEQTTRSPLGVALHDLVLKPLAIDGVRFASDRPDFSPDYDPKWIYHGLLVERLAQAVPLLRCLLTGDLLPQPLLSSMLDRYSRGGPIMGRPWKTPAYGLGLMIGETTGGELITGPTGGGPGSVVAVYHRLDRATGTAAAFDPDGTDATVEGSCVDLLRQLS